MSARRRQELWCHACDNHVQFVVDMELDGNHVLNCPNCGHEHCRVVKDGVITDDRWDQRNGQTYKIYQTQYSNTAMYTSTSSTNLYNVSVIWSGRGAST